MLKAFSCAEKRGIVLVLLICCLFANSERSDNLQPTSEVWSTTPFSYLPDYYMTVCTQVDGIVPEIDQDPLSDDVLVQETQDAHDETVDHDISMWDGAYPGPKATHAMHPTLREKLAKAKDIANWDDFFLDKKLPLDAVQSP